MEGWDCIVERSIGVGVHPVSAARLGRGAVAAVEHRVGREDIKGLSGGIPPRIVAVGVQQLGV